MINRVRLPILLVVSRTGKLNISLSPFAPENLVSRDGFGSPVLRQPAHLHTQAESGPEGNSNNGCCLFRFHHEHFFYTPLFPHTHYWCVVYILMYILLIMCDDTESIEGIITEQKYKTVGVFKLLSLSIYLLHPINVSAFIG